MWIAQTPLPIDAIHQSLRLKLPHCREDAVKPLLAEFADIEVKPIDEALKWEEENQETLRKLAIVVREIAGAVRV